MNENHIYDPNFFAENVAVVQVEIKKKILKSIHF